MNVGLLQRPGARYGRYWHTFLTELGLELPELSLSAPELYALGRDTLVDAPANIQLIVGQILAYGRQDMVLVLDSPAVPQDAWGQSLSDLLPRRISGLPQLVMLPDGGPDLEQAANELGQRLTHNAALVRSALDKARPLAKPPRLEMPPLTLASHSTVAVIGLPSVLEDLFFMEALRQKFIDLALFPVYASHLPPEQVEQRATRGQDFKGRPLQGAERFLFGAQSLLEGKGAVRGLVYVTAERDAATHEALLRLQKQAHKPTVLLSLDPEQLDLSALDRFARQVDAGATVRSGSEESGA